MFSVEVKTEPEVDSAGNKFGNYKSENLTMVLSQGIRLILPKMTRHTR